MKSFIKALTFFMLICFLSGCTQKSQDKAPHNGESITICAAVSLKEALDEIKPEFEKNRTITLTLNLSASGTLQKQIEEGAPADLFISAGVKQMDALDSKNLIDKSSRKDLLKNRLVLVVSKEYKDKIKNVGDLLYINAKISIGEPLTVPAGQYAKESFINMNIWDSLKDKIVYTKDVKQALTYVEKGETAAGVVYNSDATTIKESIVVQVFEDNTHSPITYPAAIISQSKNKDSAKAFLDYLLTDEAQQVFKKYGFSSALR